MDALARLLARDEIRELAQRYAVAIDSRDLDALVALFVDDVRVGAKETGREALRRDFARQLGAIGVSILFVGNHVIDFDGDDRARGIVYCMAQIQDGERWIRQAIRYDDSYARRGDRWHFVRRKHRLWYGALEAQNPLQQPPAEWPKSHTGRGTLPEDLESWRRFWETLGGRS
jgi:ketosteroid isomerase-like protein